MVVTLKRGMDDQRDCNIKYRSSKWRGQKGMKQVPQESGCRVMWWWNKVRRVETEAGRSTEVQYIVNIDSTVNNTRGDIESKLSIRNDD